MAKKKNLNPPKNREERQAAAAARQKKKKRRLLIGGGVGALLLLLIWFGLQPLKGPPQIGVCRTFAELHVPYPQSLRLSSTDQLDRTTILYYNYTDAFGEQRNDMMECKFYLDPANGQLALESVQINRNPVDQDKVDTFNKTIGIVLANNPSLLIPRALEDSNLVDLRQE